MSPPALVLHAECLCSKWGFSDGDTPDALMDYWDAIGVDYNRIDWHAVLRRLVREHLVPAMETAGHAVEVFDIDTIHNPIRASQIDGVEIGPYNRVDAPFDLRPESVTVPYEAVARACGIAA